MDFQDFPMVLGKSGQYNGVGPLDMRQHTQDRGFRRTPLLADLLGFHDAFGALLHDLRKNGERVSDLQEIPLVESR